jgi:alpha-beta hydrolase superfamily lysophospholipase
MKSDFYFNSSNGKSKIHGVIWKPEGEVKAVLQVAHGMAEYIDRYDNFAKYLNSNGMLVVGNDHLGHGGSASSKEEYGYFSEKDGNDCLIKDLHQVTVNTKKDYPNIPYFLLGHSMGSFYCRQYICRYGEELDGAIVMGTAFQPRAAAAAGKAMCRAIALFEGWHYRSHLINSMAFGSYNKAFKPARTINDWLSRDTENVDRYNADERCGFIFTLNGYYNMFQGLTCLCDDSLLRKVPVGLPILVTSGGNDPVGSFGKGVTAVYEQYKKLGIKDLSIKLYPDARHEILNEINKEEVFKDILLWLEKHINSKLLSYKAASVRHDKSQHKVSK